MFYSDSILDLACLQNKSIVNDAFVNDVLFSSASIFNVRLIYTFLSDGISSTDKYKIVDIEQSC